MRDAHAETPAVQLPMIRYAQDNGWRIVPKEAALRRRGGETGLVFAQTLRTKKVSRTLMVDIDNGAPMVELTQESPEYRTITLTLPVHGRWH